MLSPVVGRWYKDLQTNRFYTIRERSGIAGVREPSTVSP